MIKRSTASNEAILNLDTTLARTSNSDLSVAYWRKCWNVRNIFFDLLNIIDFNDSMTTMSADDIKRIIVELKKLNSKNFQDRGYCIWDWKEFRKINHRNIKALKKCIKMMKKSPTMEIYFYDSW